MSATGVSAIDKGIGKTKPLTLKEGWEPVTQWVGGKSVINRNLTTLLKKLNSLEHKCEVIFLSFKIASFLICAPTSFFPVP